MMTGVLRPSLPVSAVRRTETKETPWYSEDLMSILFIESGSMDLENEAGRAVAVSKDIVLLGPGFKCTLQPKGEVTFTCLRINNDYLVDTIYWQYSHILVDRLKAKRFIQEKISGRAHHFRLHADWSEAVGKPLEKICALCSEEQPQQNICQIQANWHLVTDQVFPFMVEKQLRGWCGENTANEVAMKASNSSDAVVRGEAARARDLLETECDKEWSLGDLSSAVHMSPRQLSRVFKNAYGKTPSEYLTAVRVKSMAELLRETELNIGAVANQVGWRSRTRATTAFESYLGMSPSTYRSRARKASMAPL